MEPELFASLPTRPRRRPSCSATNWSTPTTTAPERREGRTARFLCRPDQHVEPRRGASDCRTWRDVGGHAGRHSPARCRITARTCPQKIRLRDDLGVAAPAYILSVELARRAAVVALAGRAGGRALRRASGFSLGDPAIVGNEHACSERRYPALGRGVAGGRPAGSQLPHRQCRRCRHLSPQQGLQGAAESRDRQGFRLCLPDASTVGSPSKRTFRRSRPGCSPTSLVVPYMSGGAGRGELCRDGGACRCRCANTSNISTTRRRPIRSKERVATATGVVFSIGYFVRPPGATERFEQQLGQEVVLFQNPPGGTGSS